MNNFHFYAPGSVEPGTKKSKIWCKYCNCTPKEHEKIWPNSNKDILHDYVIAHGFGKPTKEAYLLAKILLSTGDDYATAAAEIVYRQLTKEIMYNA